MAHRIKAGALWLVGMYVLCQIAADITAVKMVQIGRIILPAGTFVFAVTFTLRDLLHEKLGYKLAVHAVWIAAVANVLLVLYFLATVAMPHPVWWEAQEAYSRVLVPVLRITLASIAAELVSELLDTVVYEVVRNRSTPLLGVLWSNLASTVIDTITFTVFAFGGNLPISVIFSLALGQVAFKLFVAISSAPLIYVVHKR